MYLEARAVNTIHALLCVCVCTFINLLVQKSCEQWPQAPATLMNSILEFPAKTNPSFPKSLLLGSLSKQLKK